MRPVGFETTIPASPRLQTYALRRAAAGIGGWLLTRLMAINDQGTNKTCFYIFLYLFLRILEFKHYKHSNTGSLVLRLTCWACSPLF
jgi:hypothetical protein